MTLYESIIETARTGETDMLDRVLESAAAHAVAAGKLLTQLLDIPNDLRRCIWERLTLEVDPEPALAMLSDLDRIFVHATRPLINSYLQTLQLVQADKVVEISRLYAEADQQMMEYAAEVARANRELARLDQAKTDFIGIAAHELKTPLTLIEGYIDILEDIEMDNRLSILVSGIDRGAERMHNIINAMLDLSSLEMNRLALALNPVSLKSVVELIIAQSQRALSKRDQTIRAEGLDDLPLIEADDSRIHQVLKQLLNNAIKYTPDGGQIIISGQVIPATETEPEYVQLRVSDTGVGIAPEDREKIFEKFYRTGDSARHSTGETKFMGAGPGLGLAIARGLIEAHGGQLWAESQGFDMQNCPGSSFVIRLPVQAVPPTNVPVKQIMG